MRKKLNYKGFNAGTNIYAGINMNATMLEHIDTQLKNFLSEHLGEEMQEALADAIRHRHKTLLSVMSIKYISDGALILIEQFLDTLPFENAVSYVKGINDVIAYLDGTSKFVSRSTIFYCTNMKLMKIIIKYANNINALEYGRTPLAQACLTFNLEKINFLLDHGADINIRTRETMTPLMCCCQEINKPSVDMLNASEVIETLLHRGADPLARVPTHLTIANVYNKCGGYKAYDFVTHKDALPERLSQLLQGCIRLNRTKRAKS